MAETVPGYDNSLLGRKKKFFLDFIMWAIFKVFIESVTILILLYILLFFFFFGLEICGILFP